MWQISLRNQSVDIVSNIQKAAHLLDGTMIPYGDSVDLMALLGSITQADGWAAAEEQSWSAAYRQFLPGFSDEAATSDNHPGGGAEIVLAAMANGAGTIGCNITMQTSGAYILGGNVTITNSQYDSGLELRAQVNGSLLIVAARDAALPYGKPTLFTME